MAKMREVRVTKPGAAKAVSAKSPKYVTSFNADGVKVTTCMTVFKEPKRLTARC
jgi:hypothetical protein